MLKQTILTLSTVTLIFAQSTMCYKENHMSPSTIETIKLDGGECKSSKSVQDMKNDGWTVSNISINAGSSGMNYMYVFSKDSNNTSNLSSITKEELRAEMKQLAQEEKVALEKARVEKKAQMGASIYKNTCSKCHGNNGEIAAYGKGRELRNMSTDDLIFAIEGYSHGDKDSEYGLAMIMKPYAAPLSTEEIKAVAEYIQTLK